MTMKSTMLFVIFFTVTPLIIGAVHIIVDYVIKPHKSLREGLIDWIEESDGDI